MQSPATSESQHEELGRRIRSLTSILHNFKFQKSSTQSAEISVFLRHFTTLVMCCDKHDRGAKKVIAVAGSISPQDVRAVVVTQNPYSDPLVQKIRPTIVDKEEGRVTRQDSYLTRHIKRMLRLLSTFDPRAGAAQIKSFEVFFLSQNFCEFEARFKEDIRHCGGRRLHQVIKEWKPDPNLRELHCSWVNPPEWLLDFSRGFKIQSRNIEGQSQLEFSDKTKYAWSMILAALLVGVERCIERLKAARGLMGRTAGGELKRGLDKLNERISFLHSFISWKAGVVKCLLTQTTMVSSIATVFMQMDSDATNIDLVELDHEAQEAKGEQVFHYLRMITAWHAVVNGFCSNPAFPELLKNLKVGLVEVPPSPTSVLSLEEICSEFFSRFPEKLEIREAVSELIQSRHLSEFSGCVHAEATLMGLLSYSRSGLGRTSYALGVGPEDSAMLQHVIQPVAEAPKPVIAVSKKCCWCCDWLGKNLECDFTLPGTHGIMFPWDPPRAGVSVSVLEKLEQELWQVLHGVVSKHTEPSYSRHNSPTGSLGSPSRDPETNPSSFSELMQDFSEAGWQV